MAMAPLAVTVHESVGGIDGFTRTFADVMLQFASPVVIGNDRPGIDAFALPTVSTVRVSKSARMMTTESGAGGVGGRGEGASVAGRQGGGKPSARRPW